MAVSEGLVMAVSPAFPILDQGPPFVLISQFTIVPFWPERETPTVEFIQASDAETEEDPPTVVVLTEIVREEHIVVLQVPCALKKYVVVPVGKTVILVPVPAGVPPQVPVNHCQSAPDPNEPPLTDKTEEPFWQIGFTEAFIAAGADDVVSGVNVML